MTAPTNQQLARRKRVQSYTAAGTATLGLAALGSKGLAVAAPKASRFAKLPKAKLTRIGQRADKAAGNLTVGSAGVGGGSGLLFANIQNAESKKIRKNLESGMDFGLGSVRHGVAITEDVEKRELTNKEKAQAKANAKARGTKAGAYDNLRAAGKPMGVTKAYDSERGRLKRLDGYSAGATAGAGALGLAAGQQGVKGVKQMRNAKTLKPFKAGIKASGRGAALGAGALGAGMAANRINAFKKGSGRQY